MTPGSAPADLLPILAGVQQEILSHSSLITLMTDRHLDLYRRERARQPIEYVIANMRGNLEIGLTGPGSVFHIRFGYSDPAKAHDTVQALVAKFDPATMPTHPIWPDHSRLLMYMGFGSGFMAALIISALRRLTEPAMPLPAVSA